MTLPPLIASLVKQLPYAPRLPKPPAIRARGAQPANANAHKHGKYSYWRPTQLPRLHTITSWLKSESLLPTANPQAVLASVDLNTRVLQNAFDVADRNNDFQTTLALTGVLFRNISVKVHTYRALRLEASELERTALSCFPLINWSLTQRLGRVRAVNDDCTNNLPPYSFRGTLEKSGKKRLKPSAYEQPRFEPVLAALEDKGSETLRTNADDKDSPGEFSWLTEAQWRLVAHLLPPVPLQAVRGRPALSSRKLLNAVFWKLAYHVSWADLPPSFPSSRTCRKWYKSWLSSGALLSIYKILFRDLWNRGRVLPIILVDQGCFELTPTNRIAFSTHCPESWQVRTSLLFIQQGYALIRSLRRDLKNPYFPVPSLTDGFSAAILKWLLAI